MDSVSLACPETLTYGHEDAQAGRLLPSGILLISLRPRDRYAIQESSLGRTCGMYPLNHGRNKTRYKNISWHEHLLLLMILSHAVIGGLTTVKPCRPIPRRKTLRAHPPCPFLMSAATGKRLVHQHPAPPSATYLPCLMNALTGWRGWSMYCSSEGFDRRRAGVGIPLGREGPAHPEGEDMSSLRGWIVLCSAICSRMPAANRLGSDEM